MNKLYAVIHSMYHFRHSVYKPGVNDVRQTEIDAAGPLVPETSALDLRWLLKSYVTPTEKILAGGRQGIVESVN